MYLHALKFRARAVASGFTLMELMVSVAILVIVILAVGIIFQSASRAVGVSQATLTMLSNTDATQGQFQRDVSAIDKNGFLVIRSVSNGGRRFDQISFIALGNFPNRTGVSDVTQPFTDPLVASAALVWYGQLAIQSATPPAGGNYLVANQGTAVALTALPSGVNDGDFILGRHTTLLVSPSGNNAPGYTPIGLNYRGYAGCQWNTPAISAITSETNSQISCSRLDLALLTAGSLEQSIVDFFTAPVTRTTNPTYEADNYCYRFACLKSPYDSESGAATAGAPMLYNGYFRMHPIMLQGVSSFAVDWNDGTSTALAGLTWYGLGSPKGDPAIEPSSPSHSDGYQAIFSFDNHAKWPKSLRFRYHVADPTGRLPAGRDFVQVTNLP
jgi:prepilin-type N-terminal cleavage/methylation domain-containing protein